MKTKEILKNIGLSLFTIIIVFILAEVGFRIYTSSNIIYDIEMHKYAKQLKRQSDIEGLSHEHIPNSEATLMNVDVKINSSGFRDDELKDKSEFDNRIMLVGSSITMGWGVERKDNLESKLEDNFKKANFNIDVVNTGIGNYNTVLEEKLLKKNIKIVKPDIVILHYFINDCEVLGAGNHNIFIENSYLVAYLYVRIAQAMHAKSNHYSSIGEYYRNLYNDDSEGWNAAKIAIKDMNKTCEENGSKFIVMIQPDLHNLAIDSKQEECYSIIKNYLNSQSIDYLNLSAPFRSNFGDKPMDIWVHEDDSHPNKEGHKVIADNLFSFIKGFIENDESN